MPKKVDTLLWEALKEGGIIPLPEIDDLWQEMGSSQESLQELLIKRGLLTEKEIVKLWAERFHLPTRELKELSIPQSVLDKVPIKIASYYGFIPLEIKDGYLTIAVSSPLELRIQDEIRTQLGYPIAVVLCCQEEIREAMKRYYGLAADTLEKIVSTGSALTSQVSHQSVEDIEKLAEDASVIKLVNQIILEGWKKRTTDIHLEPSRQGVSLRYRVDGLLYDAYVPPEIKNFFNAIISRIKIMSNLDIVERRLPQDGRAMVKVHNEMLDLRISTIPTPFGESIVIRILPSKMFFSLEKLGLSVRDLETFEILIQKPYGIIFVTGPTGSGKTTTLYASLSRINTRERKIITIEDPIECEMAGMTQIQVAPEIGLDFAWGLRSILRHDPDVIMVGEVRDLETAEIAVRVALTGHLVFSTLHTNDAASGITRLIDIGVEPYLVASSVEAFIAQRLVRVLCPNCKYEDPKAPVELKAQIARDLKLGSLKEAKIFRGRGCPSCNATGFWGRTAIYEVLCLDESIRDLILKKTPSNHIQRQALSQGMRTLREDGWQKVIHGVTTPEEVVKVTSASEVSSAGGKTIAFSSPTMTKEVSGHAPREEKRSYQRLSKRLKISYKIFRSAQEPESQNPPREKHAITENISAAGLIFTSTEPLPVGMLLELKIELPHAQKVFECLAKILRAERIPEKELYHIAASFLDLNSVQRSWLQRCFEMEKSF